MMDLNVAVMDMVDNSAPDESEASELDAVIEEEEDEMEDSEVCVYVRVGEGLEQGVVLNYLWFDFYLPSVLELGIIMFGLC